MAARRNLPSRKKLWTFGAADPISSPTLAEDLVVFGTDNAEGALYALDKSAGEVRWTVEDLLGIAGAPCVHGDRVWVGSRDHKLHAFNRSTGERLWTYKTDGPIIRDPTWVSDRILIPSQDGQLHAVSARSGKRAWTFSNVLEHLAPPVSHLGRLYVGGWGLFAISPPTGPRWHFPTQGRARLRPVVVDGNLYFSTWHLYALDLHAREPVQLWMFNPTSHICTSPAVTADRVYVGTARGELTCLDRADGHVVWSLVVGERLSGPPIVSKGEVIAAAAHGEVVGIDEATGEAAWRYRAAGPIESYLLLDERTLYIPTTAGTLEVLDLNRSVPYQPPVAARPPGAQPQHDDAPDHRPRRLPPARPLSVPDADDLQARLTRQRPPLPEASRWHRLTWRLRRPDALATLDATATRLTFRSTRVETPFDLVWEGPFVVQLSAWLVDAHTVDVHVTLRQTGDVHPGPPIAFTTPLPQRCVSRNLPLHQDNLPFLAPSDFDRLWPRIAFYATTSGAWLASLLRTASTDAAI